MHAVCAAHADCLLLCSSHWSDIHQMLLKALPDQSILCFAHTVTSFSQDASGVVVKATKKAEDGTEQELSFRGDLMVAADGSMSSTRAKLTGDDTRRSFLVLMHACPSSHMAAKLLPVHAGC